ncbi:MAG: fatty acyl-AMP ligase [Xanthomonadaceae bacterium]|nr:fatty acyl-AMP ligase [Xanthomonadaceae bacterium]
METLVDILRTRALTDPDGIAYIFLKGSEECKITYAQLDLEARRVAKLLEGQGSSALICHLPGLEYIYSFFGCLYAGVIAIPIYPPRFNQKLDRLSAIVSEIDVKCALISQSVLENVKPLLSEQPNLSQVKFIKTDLPHSLTANDLPFLQPEITGQSLAFLQFTSGSTSQPKGVMLTHANLINNLQAIHEKFESSKDSVGVIWLPPYHDMGLIGGILQPLYIGFPIFLMSPYSFLQRPMRWLQAVSQYKATISGAPNFAFDLCTKRITDEQAATLDLSSWKLAFCGAETVHAHVLENFYQKFKVAGFKKEAFYPCYGLAEATLIVSGGVKDKAVIVESFDATAIESQGRAVKSSVDLKSSRSYVGCGTAPKKYSIKIVDPITLKSLPDGAVGEIWFTGPSVAQGYWGRSEESERTFKAKIAGDSETNYLRTGDLGFLQGDELFVAGRIKDLLIIRGRNLYPQDIEKSVGESHPGLVSGTSAAFSIEFQGEEKLVVVQELDRRDAKPELLQEKSTEFIELIRKKIFEDHDLPVHAIALVKSHSIPITSSGKVQRQATRRLFLDNALPELRRFQEGVQVSS